MDKIISPLIRIQYMGVISTVGADRTAVPANYKSGNACFPACYVELYDDGRGRGAAYYLAAEEYVAAHFPRDNYLFTWIVGPTVVIGRNQSLTDELDWPYCRSHGIDVVRRKSGGGCIYADEGNIMTSWITGPGNVTPLFAEYSEHIARSLEAAGVRVEISGRNDILLDGQRKICGNAFYHLPERNIVHGTMLYDTNFEHMSRALTPDKSKLQHSGVKSVRSRIGLLKDALGMNIAELRAHLRATLSDRTLKISATDNECIRRLEARYRRPDYLFGKSSPLSIKCSDYLPQCGSLVVHLGLQADGRIETVRLTGDFFEEGDAQAAFSQALRGCRLTEGSVRKAVMSTHPERSIKGLSAAALIRLLTQQTDRPTS